ncbi:MAG: biotin/lipoyl-binding protein, partial [Eubacteriales bacterium]|nr:biotin/lipoyl-binding protein [Eubacteriales bacterium]
MKKLNSKAKKTVISVSAGAAAVAIVAGIVSGLRGRGEPVGVYPFPMVGMTEFWGDNQESYGPVTTDRIQTVFLSDTQTITEVLVSEGDTVKKGDVLMTYDTTLSELELERKRLDVEKANLQVKEAQEELARINQLEPMGDVDFDFPSVSTDYGREISEKKYEIHPDLKYDGSSEEKPLVVWVSADKPLDNSLLKYLYATAVDFQIQNTENVDSSASAMPEDDSGSGTKDQNAQDDGSNPLGGGDNQTPSGGDNQTTG